MDFLGQRLWEPWRFTNSLAWCSGGFRIRQGQRPSSSRMGSQLLKWRTIESTKNIAGAGLEALLPLRNMIRSRGSPCFLKLPWLQHGSISEFDGSLIYSRQVKCWDFSSSDGELTFSKKKKKSQILQNDSRAAHYFRWKGQLCRLSLLRSFLCGSSFKSFIPKCSYWSVSHSFYVSLSSVPAKHPFPLTPEVLSGAQQLRSSRVQICFQYPISKKFYMYDFI